MKMADFISFEADVEVDFEHDDKVSNISDSDFLKSFIVNEEVNTDVNFYRHFNNIETNIEQTSRNAYDKAVDDVEKFDEISNLCESSEEELEIDDFKNSEEKINNFHEDLFPETNNDQEKNIMNLLEQF